MGCFGSPFCWLKGLTDRSIFDILTKWIEKAPSALKVKSNGGKLILKSAPPIVSNIVYHIVKNVAAIGDFVGKSVPARFTQCRKANLAHNAARASARRAKERTSKVGSADAVRKIYARAQELRQWFDVVVDHKVPLCKGGAHSPSNLQIIYAFENARKGSRLDYKPTVVFT